MSPLFFSSHSHSNGFQLGCGHGLPGIFACLKGAAVIHFQDFDAEVLECLTIPNVNANCLKKSQNLATDVADQAELRFFAGDWSELPVERTQIIAQGGSISALPSLYKLIKKCMSRPHGVIYMAAKKNYFGVGGGSRRFLSVVEKDGVMAASPITEVADGSSNVREVLKLSYK
ncbi:unnamed protein product [Ilex paraguariensis]|uniref:Uncharacterized protein n=1 Tax=Ilex paraguariensis TaxID=185542 RepID=A0ABC8T6T5_9AQUA